MSLLSLRPRALGPASGGRPLARRASLALLLLLLGACAPRTPVEHLLPPPGQSVNDVSDIDPVALQASEDFVALLLEHVPQVDEQLVSGRDRLLAGLLADPPPGTPWLTEAEKTAMRAYLGTRIDADARRALTLMFARLMTRTWSDARIEVYALALSRCHPCDEQSARLLLRGGADLLRATADAGDDAGHLYDAEIDATLARKVRDEGYAIVPNGEARSILVLRLAGLASLNAAEAARD